MRRERNDWMLDLGNVGMEGMALRRNGVINCGVNYVDCVMQDRHGGTYYDSIQFWTIMVG
jgi:hypothetical protein